MADNPHIPPHSIAPCDKCGGAGGLESFEINITRPCEAVPQETRWRVKCAKCGHMTPHFGSAALCVTLWNSWAGGQAGRMNCLFPKCRDTVLARGLCANHYNTASKLVRAGRVTWAKLVAKGKALEAIRPDTHRKTPNQVWFLDR